MLTAAGFTLQDSLIIDVDIESSPSNAVGRYALAVLQRVRQTVGRALSAEDLGALDQLLDTSSPHSILRRSDLAVRTTRSVWVACPSNEEAPVAIAPLEPTGADGPNEWFSAAAEAANCQRVLGDRRHGLDTSEPQRRP
jgi:hypothetical protein